MYIPLSQSFPAAHDIANITASFLYTRPMRNLSEVLTQLLLLCDPRLVKVSVESSQQAILLLIYQNYFITILQHLHTKLRDKIYT